MSAFACINVPDKSENLTEYQNKFCICCLDPNKLFLISLTCEHAEILERLTEIMFINGELGPPLICNECHTILENIKSFKDQVETNDCILKSNCPKVPFKSKTLGFRDIEIFDSIIAAALKDDEVKIKTEPIIDEGNIIYEDTTDYHDNSNDYDMDKPLAQIKFKQSLQQKKSIKKVKCKRKPVEKRETRTGIIYSQKSSSYSDWKYEGKIKKITLTEEEMLVERIKDSTSDAFLKFPYKCSMCVIGFEHEVKLNEHNQKKHSEKDDGVTCLVCQTVLSTQASYATHLARHYRRYECEACGKRGSDLYSLVQHYNESHELIEMHTIACKQCDFTTQSHRKYRYHLEQHKGRPKCTECGKDFVSNSGLKHHMITVHTETTGTYRCALCGKSYKNRAGLKAHMNVHHNDSTVTAYCTLCKVHFRNEILLQRHIKNSLKHRTENDEKFQCQECDAKFLTKMTLQYHRRVAHGNDENQCELCDKKYTTKRNLRRHRESAHEKKRAPRNKICDHCGRGFTTNMILQSHIRSHTGERPFTCKHCSATFGHKGALYTHTRLLHGLKKQKPE